MRSSASSTAQIKPGDKLTGRYYQASGPGALQAAAAAATVSNNAAEAPSAHKAERVGRLADLERNVAANPRIEELWLLFALQHIDFGAVESMQGEPCSSSCFRASRRKVSSMSFQCSYSFCILGSRRSIRQGSVQQEI